MAETVDYHELAARLKTAPGDTGIYYIVRYPRRWRLFPLPKRAFGDQVHIAAWRTLVAPDLASACSSVLGIDKETLSVSLSSLPHAFPRGRIERASASEYTIYHGDDWQGTGVTPSQILTAFTLTNSTVGWTVDPHEQCNEQQKESIRQLLGLTENW